MNVETGDLNDIAEPVEALIVISFGGPEQPDDVMPFLENVTRGRGVPRERLLEVAEHYYHFGGRSPINDQNRALMEALKQRMAERGLGLPIYWGNRNWHPLLADTLRQMQRDGIRRASAFITSAFGSYSGCRQYLDDIEQARAAVGSGAPELIPLPLFSSHNGFLDPMTERVESALARFTSHPHVAFTAHSVPRVMAQGSGYVEQLQAACQAIAERLQLRDWTLVYQSRSGSPTQPWLEPDIMDHIRSLHRALVRDILLVPIGFISDHMEVLYDLDTEAAALCDELGIRYERAGTVGTHPKFVDMILDLLGQWRTCPPNCCPRPRLPLTPASGQRAGSTAPRGN
jgi:ferrochelatase